jgi:hypothetical protein
MARMPGGDLGQRSRRAVTSQSWATALSATAFWRGAPDGTSGGRDSPGASARRPLSANGPAPAQEPYGSAEHRRDRRAAPPSRVAKSAPGESLRPPGGPQRPSQPPLHPDHHRPILGPPDASGHRGPACGRRAADTEVFRSDCLLALGGRTWPRGAPGEALSIVWNQKVVGVGKRPKANQRNPGLCEPCDRLRVAAVTRHH